MSHIAVTHTTYHGTYIDLVVMLHSDIIYKYDMTSKSINYKIPTLGCTPPTKRNNFRPKSEDHNNSLKQQKKLFDRKDIMEIGLYGGRQSIPVGL